MLSDGCRTHSQLLRESSSYRSLALSLYSSLAPEATEVLAFSSGRNSSRDELAYDTISDGLNWLLGQVKSRQREQVDVCIRMSVKQWRMLAKSIRGERFQLRRKWSDFLKSLNKEEIGRAEESVKQMLNVESLRGSSFIDIGLGSRLYSLSSRRSGACVHLFDDDPYSVASTGELRRRYLPKDRNWGVERGLCSTIRI